MTRSRKALAPALHDAFEAFWKAYPTRRPNPKAIARLAFQRAVDEGADAAQLARAAERFAEEVRREKIEPTFVPHARTFLAQRRYEDYPDPPPAQASERSAEEDPIRARLLASGMSLAEWTAWIEPLEISVDAATARCIAPSRLIAERVAQQHLRQLATALGVSAVRIEVRR